ncbi:cell division protein CrgA [Granulicoccus phenolivorans]|uniref:cell division protein CrgA n=1 Tax=Granulicoccus phenolivorans TaxID=266854 RepID=UPI0003FAA225|nr:cell division protein CrgA [Granulicoccus phenolivorans]
MAKKKKPAVTDAESTLTEEAVVAEGARVETADDLADVSAADPSETGSDEPTETDEPTEAEAGPAKRSRNTAPKKARTTVAEDSDAASEDAAEDADATPKSRAKSTGKAASSVDRRGPKARNTKGKKKRKKKVAGPGSRRWVVPLFLVLLLLGVVWLVVFYIGSVTGFIFDVPVMGKLGNWNILIGMGLMGASFFTMTLWK